jgi:hypothetical protein
MDLIGDQAMRFTVDSLGGLFAGSLDQAENCSTALVHPVLFITHPILGLNLKVLGMRIGDCLFGRAVYLLVNVHIEWHLIYLLSS